jgi:hypothetical protein
MEPEFARILRAVSYRMTADGALSDPLHFHGVVSVPPC